MEQTLQRILVEVDDELPVHQSQIVNTRSIRDRGAGRVPILEVWYVETERHRGE